MRADYLELHCETMDDFGVFVAHRDRARPTDIRKALGRVKRRNLVPVLAKALIEYSASGEAKDGRKPVESLTHPPDDNRDGLAAFLEQIDRILPTVREVFSDAEVARCTRYTSWEQLRAEVLPRDGSSPTLANRERKLFLTWTAPRYPELASALSASVLTFLTGRTLAFLGEVVTTKKAIAVLAAGVLAIGLYRAFGPKTEGWGKVKFDLRPKEVYVQVDAYCIDRESMLPMGCKQAANCKTLKDSAQVKVPPNLKGRVSVCDRKR